MRLINLTLSPDQQPVLGSLTLGGYDSSRFFQTNATFPLAGNDSESLAIRIESIAASKTLVNNVTLLSNGIVALIDTTLPYFWLPLSVCRQFESAFGLSWDPSTYMYLVNDTIHQQLQNLNPPVTFTLGNSSANQSINITLPYGAFDLQASSPIYPNGTNYFPLRPASTTTGYVLGRAFLQEAYLLVDFEQGNFSVSQALFPANPVPNIIAIDHSSPPSVSGTNATQPSATQTHHQHLSAGAIAGIAIGASTLLILLCTIAFFLSRRRRRGDDQTPPTQPSADTSSPPPFGEKESWPNSPGHFSDTDASTNSNATTIPQVRELEDTQAPRKVGSRSRQELAGSPTAKELPPLPANESGKARHISELAGDGFWTWRGKQ